MRCLGILVVIIHQAELLRALVPAMLLDFLYGQTWHQQMWTCVSSDCCNQSFHAGTTGCMGSVQALGLYSPALDHPIL